MQCVHCGAKTPGTGASCKWRANYTACIVDAQHAGEIDADADAEALGTYFCAVFAPSAGKRREAPSIHSCTNTDRQGDKLRL